MTIASTIAPAVTRSLSEQWPRTVGRHFLGKDPATTLMILTGFMGVPAAIATPWVTNAQLKRAGIEDRHRKLLVNQEVSRQVVSASLHFLSYFGGMWLTGKVLKGAYAQNPLWKFLGAVALSTLSNGFLRPLLTNSLFLRYGYSQGGSSGAVRPAGLSQPARSTSSVFPEPPSLPLQPFPLPASQNPPSRFRNIPPRPNRFSSVNTYPTSYPFSK